MTSTREQRHARNGGDHGGTRARGGGGAGIDVLRGATMCALCFALASPWLALGGCTNDTAGAPDQDLGPIDDSLTPSERVNWPGIDRGAGREIPLVRGFGNGHEASYWFLGFAAKRSADSFWFCRDGDTACPLDEHRRLNWDHIVGHPLFMRIPGQNGFSPFWQMWIVHVPADYDADSVKTLETLQRLDQAGAVRVAPFVLDFGDVFGTYRGPQEVVLHCALVLTSTTMAEAGHQIPGGTDPMLVLQNRFGWHNGYRVEFVDFSRSDGVFPAAVGSDARPLMPFANIYISWRRCNDDPRPEICDIPGYALRDQRPVSERGLGQDITGNGRASDTNNTIGATPCQLQRANELPYSPLWRVSKLVVQPGGNVGLIDTYHDSSRSDIRSADDIFELAAEGRISAPMPMREDEQGNPVPGNEGTVFFNCPSPVPQGYVPYPCSDNP